MLDTMYWWRVADFSSVICGTFPRPYTRFWTAARQYYALCKQRTASREEIRAHVAPAVSPRTFGNRLLVAGLRSRVPLASYHLHHDTAKHGYSGVVKESTGEWNDALLSSVTRIGSVDM